MIGSRTMMDDGLQLAITVPGRHRRPAAAVGVGQEPADGDSTLLPFYLDPMTKLFLVALMWCRPWLLDPSAASPLPRTPEIARAALEATGAHHELDRFDSNPEFRDRLAARVAEHIKVLRRKITERGLAGPDVRLSDEVAVRVLIEHGVVAAGDLRLLADPAWCSRQEDLWWTRELRHATWRPAGLRCVGRRVADWRLGLIVVDEERGGGNAPIGSGDHHAVRARRDRAAEEVVPLVDRVAERSLFVGNRAVRRDARDARTDEFDRDRREGDVPVSVDYVHGVTVTERLAHAELGCSGDHHGRARRRPRGDGRALDPLSRNPVPIPAASSTTTAAAARPAHTNGRLPGAVRPLARGSGSRRRRPGRDGGAGGRGGRRRFEARQRGMRSGRRVIGHQEGRAIRSAANRVLVVVVLVVARRSWPRRGSQGGARTRR